MQGLFIWTCTCFGVRRLVAGGSLALSSESKAPWRAHGTQGANTAEGAGCVAVGHPRRGGVARAGHRPGAAVQLGAVQAAPPVAVLGENGVLQTQAASRALSTCSRMGSAVYVKITGEGGTGYGCCKRESGDYWLWLVERGGAAGGFAVGGNFGCWVMACQDGKDKESLDSRGVGLALEG
jgi:hypothetical protein